MYYIFVDSDQAPGSIKILDLSLKFIIFKLFTCQEWMTKFSRKWNNGIYWEDNFKQILKFFAFSIFTLLAYEQILT